MREWREWRWGGTCSAGLLVCSALFSWTLTLTGFLLCPFECCQGFETGLPHLWTMKWALHNVSTWMYEMRVLYVQSYHSSFSKALTDICMLFVFIIKWNLSVLFQRSSLKWKPRPLLLTLARLTSTPRSRRGWMVWRLVFLVRVDLVFFLH